MFLLGGPAFSGKTLLAHLLTQGRVVCLDEPDFHNRAQRHRGVPVLRERFPETTFADAPERALTYREAVALLERYETAVTPYELGMKTAGWTFVEYARVYKELGYPTIAMVRDIRDVLVESPLPASVGGETGLNANFRVVHANASLIDLRIRYEDLVFDPDQVFASIASLLAQEVRAPTTWSATQVHRSLLKYDRHEMLLAGRICTSQVGIWRSSGQVFSAETWSTAEMMGYGRD